MSIPVVQLNNGVYLPVISLGTYRMFNGDGQVERAIKSAVELGYHATDTAQQYNNEKDIAAAVKTYGTTREVEMPIDKEGLDNVKWITEKEWAENRRLPHGGEAVSRIFVTTKAWVEHFTTEGINKFIDEHLTTFGVGCDDMIILHWPGMVPAFEGLMENGAITVKDNSHETRLTAWKALEEAYYAKKFRAIGVSNFMYRHLKPLLENIEARKAAGDPKATFPMCNQCEFSPLMAWEPQLVELMKQYKIVGTAYSPLCLNKPVLMENELMLSLSNKYNKPVSAIALRFVLQSGICILPKSASAANQKKNLDAFSFSISSEDMERIRQLQTTSNIRFCPDPFLIE